VEADEDRDPTRVGPYPEGDPLVWMTLDELAEVLGSSRAFARDFAVRRGLPTRVARGGPGRPPPSLYGVRGAEPWSSTVPERVAGASPNPAGQLLRRLRQKADISQSELSARLEVSQAMISRYEDGDADDKLTMHFICKAAEACDAAMGLGDWRGQGPAERSPNTREPARVERSGAQQRSRRGRASSANTSQTDLLADATADQFRIFISYRRQDAAGNAGRLLDRLEREFGRKSLFFDVDSIPLGLNFVTILRQEVTRCNVLLALIGPAWARIRNEAGARCLENPLDFVRIEIATALARDIPVVPVLFDGTAIPTQDELPDELKELALRNGLSIRHESFHADAGKLAKALEAIAAEPKPKQRREAVERRQAEEARQAEARRTAERAREAEEKRISEQQDKQSAKQEDRVPSAELQRLTTELTRHLGPVATLLVKRALPGVASAGALWQAVAAHIENSDARAAFREAP